MFEVTFNENYAVLHMKSGENRFNVEFLKQFHSALDEIERYLFLIKSRSSEYNLCEFKFNYAHINGLHHWNLTTGSSSQLGILTITTDPWVFESGIWVGI